MNTSLLPPASSGLHTSLSSIHHQCEDIIKIIENYSNSISCSGRHKRQLTTVPICKSQSRIRNIIPSFDCGDGFQNIFIYDSYLKYIVLVDMKSGKVVREFGAIHHDPNMCTSPSFIEDLSCREFNQELYVLGFQDTQSLIYIFTNNGDLRRSFSVLLQNLERPVAFAFLPNGDIVILYENDESTTFEIAVFSQLGQKVKQFKVVIYSLSTTNNIGLEIHGDKILVMSTIRIFIINFNGELLKTFAREPRGVSAFSQLSISLTGEVFVSYCGEKFIDVLLIDGGGNLKKKRVIQMDTEPRHFALLQSGHCVVLSTDNHVFIWE